MSEIAEYGGLAYDFGVQIAHGTVAGLAQTALKVAALTVSIREMYQAITETDDIIRTNQIAMGGYVNTLNALKFAEQKAGEGIGFAADDLMSGMRSLQFVGMNAKANLDVVAKAADAANMSFSQMTNIIRTADFSALADMGIITQRTAISYQQMGFNAQQASRQVASLVKSANAKGLFEDTILTMDKILLRFSTYKEEFVKAIVGDPKDPGGLAYNFKKYLNSIADWVHHHIGTIKYYGAIIGKVFLFTIQVVGDFLKRTFNYVKDIFHLHHKTAASMQESIMSFGLWLSIQRAFINKFFDEYGDRILTTIKLLGSLYVAFRVISFITETATALRGLAAAVQAYTASLSGAALLNPYVAIAAALVGIIVYWKEIREFADSLTNSYWIMLSPVLTIAKYWVQIKTTAINLWSIIKNITAIISGSLSAAIDRAKNAFSSIFPDAAKWVSKLWTAFKDYFIKPVSNFFNGLIGNIFNGVANWSADAANSTAGAVNQMNAKAGTNYTASSGVSLSYMQLKDATDRAAEKAKKLADNAPSAYAPTTPPTVTDYGNTGGSNVYNSGAININVSGKNYDENALARKIMLLIKQESVTTNVRAGVTKTH